VDASFPAPYTARPATLDDAEAVAALLNLTAVGFVGEPSTTPENLCSEWQAPGYDLAALSMIAEAPDGSLAACALVETPAPHHEVFVAVDVAPAHRGVGLDLALLRWVEGLAPGLVVAAPAGAETVLRWGAWVGEDDLAAMLQAHRYALVRHFWRMTIDLDRPPAAPAWPTGIAARRFRRGEDERATYEAVTEAFRDHWGGDEEPYDEWLWSKVESPAAGFDADLWILALDGREIAGVAINQPRARFDPAVGYVRVVGVRRPWRRRGLARALLLESFAALRARGATAAALDVDAASPTGAVALYEGVGMTSCPRFEVWEKPVVRASAPPRTG